MGPQNRVCLVSRIAILGEVAKSDDKVTLRLAREHSRTGFYNGKKAKRRRIKGRRDVGRKGEKNALVFLLLVSG